MNTAPGDQQPLRAEPVEQHPDGDLHRGVHQQLEHGERGQLRGGDVEPLGRGQAGDAERGAVEDRQEVHRDGGAPDHDRAPAAEPDGLAQCDSLASAIDHWRWSLTAAQKASRVVAAQGLDDADVLVDRRLHPVGAAAHHRRGEQRLPLAQGAVDRGQHGVVGGVHDHLVEQPVRRGEAGGVVLTAAADLRLEGGLDLGQQGVPAGERPGRGVVLDQHPGLEHVLDVVHRERAHQGAAARLQRAPGPRPRAGAARRARASGSTRSRGPGRPR